MNYKIHTERNTKTGQGKKWKWTITDYGGNPIANGDADNLNLAWIAVINALQTELRESYEISLTPAPLPI